MLIPKNKPIRDKDHLAFIRTLPCCRCLYCAEPSQAAHIRKGSGSGGMGMKPSDSACVPLCTDCHREQHQHGEITFWGDTKPPLDLAAFLYENTGKKTSCVFRIMNFVKEFVRGFISSQG